MRTFLILFSTVLLSCVKSPVVSIRGVWQTEETTYNFNDELIITSDGELESHAYFVSNDTIYLDYGFPFKIEVLTEQELVLSKNDGVNYYLYEFDRIDS